MDEGDRAGEGNEDCNLVIACNSLAQYQKAVEYEGPSHRRGGGRQSWGRRILQTLGCAYGSQRVEHHLTHLAIAVEVGD